MAQETTGEWHQVAEELFDLAGSESSIEESDFIDQLAAWRQHPLDLNSESMEQLVTTSLISAIQMQAIQHHVNRHGPLISVYELQSVPGLDLETIRRILPFVSVSRDVGDFHVPIQRMLIQGAHEIQIRWQEYLELQKGYLDAGDTTANRFKGPPGRLYARYRYRYANRLSFGMTAEKDGGEPFFNQGNRAGFDFYSFHFFLRGYRKWLKELAIGDFRINLGQGLIYSAGYGTGKSSFVTGIRRGRSAIRPFRSASESGFLRGCGLTIRPTTKMELSVFASFLKRDAALQKDSIRNPGGKVEVSESFQTFNNSGFHRTQSELNNRNNVKHMTFGSRIQYANRWFTGNLNLVLHQFDKVLVPGRRAYQLFRPRGNSFLNASLDYTAGWRNLNVFGEIGIDRKGRVASLHGILLGLDRRVHLAVHLRHYPKDFWAIVSDPFSETGQSRNESGIYLGVDIRPVKQVKLLAYADIWKHAWLRYQVDAPSVGSEQLLRLEYKKKRKWTAYAQFRREIKFRNNPGTGAPMNRIARQRKVQLRLHASYRISKSLELRNRIEFSSYSLQGAAPKKGILFLQDMLYKPMGGVFSGTMRFALFDTEGYDARIYAYENDVIYSFSIPPHADTGMRYYLNLRYRGIRNLTLEARFGRLAYVNRETVGSGLNEIPVNHRTEVKFQLLYRW